MAIIEEKGCEMTLNGGGRDKIEEPGNKDSARSKHLDILRQGYLLARQHIHSIRMAQRSEFKLFY